MNTPQALLTDWRGGFYANTKHANVLFGYELQRRLGARGVQSCVADPGGVKSNLWDKSPMFKKGSFALWVWMECGGVSVNVWGRGGASTRPNR